MKDEFQGQILHSTQHDKATDHAGKKVAVVGACTSGEALYFTLLRILQCSPHSPAHDICSDYADHGVDITMVQRTSTYIMTNKEGMPRLMKGEVASIHHALVYLTHTT